MKKITKRKLIHYVEFDDGELVPYGDIWDIMHEFYNTDLTLRGYEMFTSSETVEVLIKYGYMKNWRGRGMANLYCTTEKIDELIDYISEDD